MNRFLLKVLLNGVVVVPLLLLFTEATVFQALVTAVILSFVAWFVGDQLILRMTNNPIATVADAVLAYFYLSVSAYIFQWSLNTGELSMIVLLLGVVEWFFHRMLVSNVQRA